MWELYGASEGGATRVSPDEWRARPGTVGLPWPGVEVRILGDDGVPLPAGDRRCRVHRARRAARAFRYHRDDAKTDAAWRDGAFTVGDIGHLDDDGYLYITDRISDIVLLDGINVYPREIEDVLLHASGRRRLRRARRARRAPRRGARRRRRGARTPWRRRARRLTSAGGSPTSRCPPRWELVDELPRDPNGKVLKRLLREQLTT